MRQLIDQLQTNATTLARPNRDKISVDREKANTETRHMLLPRCAMGPCAMTLP